MRAKGNCDYHSIERKGKKKKEEDRRGHAAAVQRAENFSSISLSGGRVVSCRICHQVTCVVHTAWLRAKHNLDFFFHLSFELALFRPLD